MKRYVVDKRALSLLGISPLNALRELSKDKTITDEPLEFNNLNMVSLILDNYQVDLLKQNDITVHEEVIIYNGALAGNYEKVRSSYYKVSKKAITGGNGVKVGILDSGASLGIVPAEFAVNFVDGSPFADVFGHGTMTSSIIKHPTIGLAPNCIFHNLKVMSDEGTLPQTPILAGLDYAIDQSLDVINLSWTADTGPIRTAIADVVASGTIVCASSGNDNAETNTLVPACLQGVIAVNSVSEGGDYHDFNVLPNPTIPTSHGITVACSGWGCEVYTKDGFLENHFGTSFSSPFFVGLFAIYKEAMDYADNDRVLEHILSRCKLTSYPRYSGAGTPSF